MTATVGKRAANSDVVPERPGGVAGVAVMGLLVLSGLFTLAFEVLYLPVYLGRGTVAPAPAEVLAAPLAASPSDGAVPFPVTVLVAGVVNVLLVAGMRIFTDRPGIALLPVLAWTLGFLACSVSGPGGDIMLLSDWPTLLLLIFGLAPPLLYTYTRTLSAS
ncbi:hypothetical protein [Nocardia bovistercoris]|uniref:Uncharacterized protein n=1 Tax=Nocardia bovistercoris TaxID=2785916 RepID=A0A931I7W8_9NOCA|nr:hypothetical protein [Nocardia bovistercoris]MBH0775916.1 hypothetical protein [Nocardia bovistercoris]